MDRYIQGQLCGPKQLYLSEQTNQLNMCVANSIAIEVENVSCVHSINFINNLKAGEPIPDIGTLQNEISVIYVYFPLGEGEAYLTTETLARDFICYAPYSWNVEKAYDKARYGVYFKLFPTSAYAFEPREKMYFSIANIVTYGELEKMVYVAVNFTAMPMETQCEHSPNITDAEDNVNGTDFLACFKKRMPLNIMAFEVLPARVTVGDWVELSWAVGGDSAQCILTHGDYAVDKVGKMKYQVTEDTEFMLYAFNADIQVVKSATVYIETPEIQSFTCDVKDGCIHYGDCVTFSYEVKNSVNIFMNQGIGKITSKTMPVIPNQKVTTYTLSCMGSKQLIEKSITISILDFLEVKKVIYYRTKKTDGSYVYTLSWSIANSLTNKITTSDGIIRSQDKPTGDLQFADASGNCLTVKIECTGSGNQYVSNTYTV